MLQRIQRDVAFPPKPSTKEFPPKLFPVYKPNFLSFAHFCMMSSFHCHQAWGFSLCAPGGGQLQSQHLGTQVKTPLWLFSMSAIRELGVTHVLATTACGSLRESITPGLFLLPSSFIGIDSDICSSPQTKQNQTGRLGGNSPSIPMMD